MLGPVLLLVGADGVDDVGEFRAREVHERGGLSTEHEFVDRPGHHRRRGHTADILVEPDAVPLALLPGPQRLLERLGNRHDVRLRVECRWVAVGLGERLGHRSLCQLRRLLEHLAHRFAVEVTEFAGGQRLLQLEHLEQVELEITDIALVVAHG